MGIENMTGQSWKRVHLIDKSRTVNFDFSYYQNLWKLSDFVIIKQEGSTVAALFYLSVRLKVTIHYKTGALFILKWKPL